MKVVDKIRVPQNRNKGFCKNRDKSSNSLDQLPGLSKILYHAVRWERTEVLAVYVARFYSKFTIKNSAVNLSLYP
jgi:hypothetical protein